MPQFNDDAIQRIRQVVRIVEARFQDATSPSQNDYAEQPLQLFKQTADLNSNTHTATANPGVWNATGSGSLSANTGITETIRDTTNSLTAGNGSWRVCRLLGTTNGAVWEILPLLGLSNPRVKGTTPGFVNSANTSFTVAALTATDGQSNPTGNSFTITNPGFCIDSNATFYAEWDSSLGTPGFRIYDAPCPASNANC